MSDSVRETFQRDALVACPYPYCGGEMSENGCLLCDRPAQKCGLCGAWNRLQASFCRRCVAPLARRPITGWNMPGRDSYRRYFVGEFRGEPRFTEAKWFRLSGLDLDAVVNSQTAQPLFLDEGLILPNPARSGFSLYIPGLERTVWTSPLGMEPTPGCPFDC